MGVCDELLVCPQVEEAAGGIVGAGADGFAIREELGKEGTHHLLIRFSSDADGIPQLVTPPASHQEAMEAAKPGGTRHWIIKFESAEGAD